MGLKCNHEILMRKRKQILKSLQSQFETIFNETTAHWYLLSRGISLVKCSIIKLNLLIETSEEKENTTTG